METMHLKSIKKSLIAVKKGGVRSCISQGKSIFIESLHLMCFSLITFFNFIITSYLTWVLDLVDHKSHVTYLIFSVDDDSSGTAHLQDPFHHPPLFVNQTVFTPSMHTTQQIYEWGGSYCIMCLIIVI